MARFVKILALVVMAGSLILSNAAVAFALQNCPHMKETLESKMAENTAENEAPPPCHGMPDTPQSKDETSVSLTDLCLGDACETCPACYAVPSLFSDNSKFLPHMKAENFEMPFRHMISETLKPLHHPPILLS
jgi:hypothetical protein